MSLRITGKHIHVAKAPMASGSGGGGDGPPKKTKVRRMWDAFVAWIRSKL